MCLRKRLFVLSVVSPLSFVSHAALAMSVTPMVVELQSATGNKASQLLVENDGAKDIQVEIRVSKIDVDESGALTAAPAQADFQIFPVQRIIKPHSSQVFRIQWAAGPLQKSQSYEVQVNQLPVKVPESATGVQVLFHWGVVVNVAPVNGHSSLDVVASGIATGEKKKRLPFVVVSNPGNAHARLQDSSMTLKSAYWSQTLTSADLQRLLGIGLVQPGKRRRFLIPIDVPENVSQLSVEVVYDKATR